MLSRLKLRACETVGADATVLGRVWVHGGGRIGIGNGVHIEGRPSPVELHAHRGAVIQLGDGVRLCTGSSVEALGRITIGDRAELGPFCKVLDSHFHPLRGDRFRWTPPLAVTIEHDAVIGERAILLPGAHVSAGARVAPGTVVNRRGRAVAAGEIPPPAQAGGVGPLERLAYLFRMAARLTRARVFFGAASRGKRVYASGYVRVVNAGRLVLGDAVQFEGGMIPIEVICRAGALLSIGGGTIFNYGSRIEATGKIEIGRKCMIASLVEICDRDGTSSAPISIGDEVWLAHGVAVRPGVRIGEKSVVGAGSVVTSDVPPESLALGNPARAIPLRLVAR